MANPLTNSFSRAMLTGVVLAVVALSGKAGAQSPDTIDRPGIERYPSWMLDTGPRISGREQDYPIWEGSRFNQADPEFLAWRNEQRRKYGPDWRSRPGYEEDLRDWLARHR